MSYDLHEPPTDLDLDEAPATHATTSDGLPHWAAPLPPPPVRRRRRGLAVPAATVALSLAAGWLGGTLSAGSGSETGAAVTATSASLAGEALDVAALLAAVEPSVVSIETTVRVRQGPFVQEGEGAGTGVVIDEAGYILTNAHVVSGATSITVTVDGEERTATLLGADDAADIAVLLLDDASGLVPATLATGSSPAVGDDVVAIGNALALEGGLTVTEGIVSALERSIETTSGTLDGLIQTDAAISSGNSGGALVDALGRVVGINTAVASSSGSVEASNIGFAIAIDDAMAVADEIIGAA